MWTKLIILVLLLTTPFVLGATEVDVGIEVVFGTGSAKFNLGLDINKVYAGFVIETTRQGLFVSLGLGGAVKIATRDLGSVLLFRASVGIGYRLNRHRLSVIFDHVSNGNLASYNPALNTFGIRYGYEF